MADQSKAKKPWESKTILFNLIFAIAPFIIYFYPDAGSWLTESNAEKLWMFLVASGLGNVLLRLVTKSPVELKSDGIHRK